MNDAETMEIEGILASDDFNVIDLVNSVMTMAERFEHLTGSDKKKYVLRIVKHILTEKWGANFYKKYEFAIPSIIEFIIDLSHNDVTISVNRMKRYKNKYFPCCS